VRAAAGALLLCCSIGCQGAQTGTPADVAPPPGNHVFSRLSFAGRWEFVRNRHDGRYKNSSARSFHPGDTLTLIYDGAGFRVYGVSGPNGGIGTVVVPGQPPAQVSFYSRQRRAHVLLYTSPPLAPGVHSAGVVVTRLTGKKRGYVNVDQIQVYGE
jgi:hypothetical protein